MSESHQNELQPAVKPRSQVWLRANIVVIMAYLFATLITDAHFTGDTVDYVASIVGYDRGTASEFWEFGHVLWRPLGWLLMRACRPLMGQYWIDDTSGTTWLLSTVSWLAGLISVLLLAAMFRRLYIRGWIVNVAVLAFMLSHGFLNFAQTGPPYVSSLVLMMAALYILWPNGGALTMRDGILAGIALGIMICFWFPFIVIVPAVLATPLLLSSVDQHKVRVLIAAGLTTGLLVAIIYFSVAVGVLGVRSLTEFTGWMTQTTGRTSQDKGLARTVLGFARSFIYLGNDGMLFKRYLVHDPFNPITPLELLRLSLWKLILFYCFVAALILNLWRSVKGKQFLGMLAITGVTVLGVAVYWQGGDVERYLALYPAMFLALGYVLSGSASRLALNHVALVFVSAAALTNVYAMSSPVLNFQQSKAIARVSSLMPSLKSESRVFVISLQDELHSFTRDFPSSPLNRSGNLKVTSLVEVGGRTAAEWRRDFVTRAQSTWNLGGDVWVTRRALSQRPRSDWNWVEGDDKRLTWNQFPDFFSQVDLGEIAGSEDGFVKVIPSARTKNVFDRLSKQ